VYDVPDKIDLAFTYHAPKGDQAERYSNLRQAAKGFARLIDTYCPDSEEKTIALQRVQEAVMWANASIARN
jgi:hypothetical protein